MKIVEEQYTVEKVYTDGYQNYFTQSDVNRNQAPKWIMSKGWGVVRMGVLIRTEIYNRKKHAERACAWYNSKMERTEEMQYA